MTRRAVLTGAGHKRVKVGPDVCAAVMDYLVEISRSNMLKPKDLWFRVLWKESNLLSLKCR